MTTNDDLRERRLSGEPVDNPGAAVAWCWANPHDNLIALILQHWFPSVDHAFWSRLTMPDMDTLTLYDEGPPELARRWDAESRFVPKSRGNNDA